MKKLLTSCLVVTGLISGMFSTCIMADEPAPEICLNGEYLQSDVEPFYLNDRTMVPLRMISEGMHYNVSWDDPSQTVNVESGKDSLSITIDEYGYTLNGDYYETDAPAVIKDDRTFVPIRFIADAFGCEVNWIAEIYTVEITYYTEVEVTTPEEFLAALQSYTIVHLTEPEYNLDEVNGYYNDNVKTDNVYDGVEYIVNNVSHLTIVGTGIDEPSSICVQPRYANVLTFNNCDAIYLNNLIIGHTIEQGYCSGGVLKFLNSFDVQINDCDLYGCGTYGIIAYDSAFITTANTAIHDCSYGAIEYRNVVNSAFEFCSVYGNEGFYLFDMNNCSYISIANTEIRDNTSDVQFLITADGCEDITFSDCTFSDNTGIEAVVAPGQNVEFKNCKGELSFG